MLFYCPRCQDEYELEPLETLTTKTGRVAYLTHCAVCDLELAEFFPVGLNMSTAEQSSDDEGTTPQ